MPINTYTEGTPVRTPFNFKNYQAAPIDPTTVQVKSAIAATLGGPLGAPTVITCTDVPPATSAPAVAHLARTGEGTYEIWWDTTGGVGYWTVEPVGVGVGQALPYPPDHVFRVVPRRIP